MTAYRDTIQSWSNAIRDGLELPGRAGVYRELVHRNISGLLQTMLPRTHSQLGDADWTRAVAAFLRQRLQQSPYFVDLAAEFAGTLSGPVADLAHYETLILDVDTTTDTETRRIAAYGHDVLGDPLLPAVTFVLIWRDPDNHATLSKAISATEFVQLAESLSYN